MAYNYNAPTEEGRRRRQRRHARRIARRILLILAVVLLAFVCYKFLQATF